MRTLRKEFNKINGYIINRKLISRLSLSCRRISMLHKNQIMSWTFYHILFSLVGVRQEQDIYVRLIDSVTKQVLYIYFSLRWISGIMNLLFSQKLCNAIMLKFWYYYWKVEIITHFNISNIHDMINMPETKQRGGKQIVFIIYGHKWYLYLILVLIAFILLYFSWPSHLAKLRHNLQFYIATDREYQYFYWLII